MLEDKGYAAFLKSVREENANNCGTNLIYGRSSDAKRYIEMAQAAGFSVVPANTRDDFSKALVDISGPLIVLILREKIGSLVKRMLTKACERKDATYILGIRSGGYLDPDTKAISLITVYTHKLVSGTPASLRVSQASKCALQIETLKLDTNNIDDKHPSNQAKYIPT